MAEGNRITGTISPGLGEGSAFMSLSWVQKILRERLGFTPYPATLNLRLDSEEEVKRWKEIRGRLAGVRITSPDPSFCAARCWHALVTTPAGEGTELSGAVLLPLVEGYPADKVEFIAAAHVKDALGARDGDRLTLEFL
jgi:riboflavin kinase